MFIGELHGVLLTSIYSKDSISALISTVSEMAIILLNKTFSTPFGISLF